MPGAYISKTKCGVVIKPGDYKSLAEAVLHLKNNPKIARQMGKNGRRYVEKYISIEKIGQIMLKIFEALRGGSN